MCIIDGKKCIKNIDRIPDNYQPIVWAGLTKALQVGLPTGSQPIENDNYKPDFFEIKDDLTGKSGAVVFSVTFGKHNDNLKPFNRVIKIQKIEKCVEESEGFNSFRNPTEIFCKLTYTKESDFEIANEKYGIILYENVNEESLDLKTLSDFIIEKLKNFQNEENFCNELKKICTELKRIFSFLSVKVYSYIKITQPSESKYKYKIEKPEIEKSICDLSKHKIKDHLASYGDFLKLYDRGCAYHSAGSNFIHGDLNPKNILVWRFNDQINSKIIDFGEIIPKNKEDFVPFFWDFSCLMGRLIINFAEKIYEDDGKKTEIKKESFYKTIGEVYQGLDVLIGKNTSIYFSTLYLPLFYHIIDEAAGHNENKRFACIKDYLNCQIAFFVFFTKFEKESLFSRLFSYCMADKFKTFCESERVKIILSNIFLKESGIQPVKPDKKKLLSEFREKFRSAKTISELKTVESEAESLLKEYPNEPGVKRLLDDALIAIQIQEAFNQLKERFDRAKSIADLKNTLTDLENLSTKASGKTENIREEADRLKTNIEDSIRIMERFNGLKERFDRAKSISDLKNTLTDLENLLTKASGKTEILCEEADRLKTDIQNSIGIMEQFNKLKEKFNMATSVPELKST